MKRDALIKKLYRLIAEIAQSYAVLIGIGVFMASTSVVFFISYLCNDHFDQKFWQNLRIEAHGMLFDIMVIGVIILLLNRLAEKRMENQRYLDEIEDFRGGEGSRRRQCTG